MKQKSKKKFFSLLVALSIIISTFAGNTTALAAEVTDNSSSSFILKNAESSEYSQPFRASRSDPDTAYWGYAKFQGAHWGENKHTVYGANARLCIAFRPADGNYSEKFKVRIRAYDLLHNNHNRFDFTMEYNPKKLDSDNYYMYVGSWTTDSYPLEYQIFYEPLGSSSSREVEYCVWVDYY